MLLRDSDGSSATKAITGSLLPHNAPGPASLWLHPGPVALLGCGVGPARNTPALHAHPGVALVPHPRRQSELVLAGHQQGATRLSRGLTAVAIRSLT
jgi:hypothetical protein